MPRIMPFACAALLTASVALAHTGVDNPVVQARMTGMMKLGTDLKVIGEMAQSKVPFDATTERAAASAIAQEGRRINALFLEPEDHPLSEARTIIWEDYAAFTALADDMVVLADGLSQSITVANDMMPALTALGQSCRACHSSYRE